MIWLIPLTTCSSISGSSTEELSRSPWSREGGRLCWEQMPGSRGQTDVLLHDGAELAVQRREALGPGFGFHCVSVESLKGCWITRSPASSLDQGLV